MSKKTPLIASIAIIVALLAATGYLTIQTITLEQTNNQLLKTNQEINKTNMELSNRLDTLSTEFEAINQSYSQLKSYFGLDPHPIISPRIGAKIIENVVNGGNYLWVTGEVENTENVTVYNAILNFTLYTYQDTQFRTINLGTMTPHQVVEIRTAVQASNFKIVNWKLDTTATYLP